MIQQVVEDLLSLATGIVKECSGGSWPISCSVAATHPQHHQRDVRQDEASPARREASA